MDLNVLAQKNENKSCADCLAKNPTWASWNIGIFLCMRCASIHRSLGAHISKVKSLTLDQWTSDKIAQMERVGNGRAKIYYEGNLPSDFIRPSDTLSLEKFIRRKYVDRTYIKPFDFPALEPDPPKLISLDNEETSVSQKVKKYFNLNEDISESTGLQDASQAGDFTDLNSFDPLFSSQVTNSKLSHSWTKLTSINDFNNNRSAMDALKKPPKVIKDKKKLTNADIMALYKKQNAGTENHSPWGFQLQTMTPHISEERNDRAPYNISYSKSVSGTGICKESKPHFNPFISAETQLKSVLDKTTNSSENSFSESNSDEQYINTLGDYAQKQFDSK